VLTFVSGFLDPFREEFAVTLEFTGKIGVVGKVVNLMRIFLVCA